jgi:hypothetical protein
MSEYPKHLSEDWVALFDTKSKKEYYANTKSKVTQWTLPDELKPRNAEDVPATTKIHTAVGNTETSSPPRRKDNDQQEINHNTPKVVAARKPVTYLHMHDPFSLKLLIWLKETNYLEFIDIKTVNEGNQAEMKADFQQLQIDIYKSLNQKNYALQQDISYPTTMYPSGDIISGADHNIHTLLSHFPNPPLPPSSDATSSPSSVSSASSIDWNSLTVFNFYSCGLLSEHSRHLHDDTLCSPSSSSGTSATGTGAGTIYSPEYLSLHEENIRLQLYLSGNQIQQFRSEQSYRVENQRLRDEIEKLSSRLIELTHKLSIERTAMYNKVTENKNLHEGINKLEEEKKNLIQIMTTQSKLHHEELDREREEKTQWKEYVFEVEKIVFGNVILKLKEEKTQEIKEEQEKEIIAAQSPGQRENSLGKFRQRIEEYQNLIGTKDEELRSLNESIRSDFPPSLSLSLSLVLMFRLLHSNLETKLSKAQTELLLFQQIIRE